jgi:hypothetical protein
MEQQIRRKMERLTWKIGESYDRSDKKRAKQLAEDFVVKGNLKTITTRQTLLKSIRTIVEKAGGPGFTEEEMAFLEALSPLMARETLIIGAQLSTYVVPKWEGKREEEESTDTGENAEGTLPNADDIDN